MDATRQNPLRGRRRPVGSALILTVVLTSLLAIVGVLFVLLSRMEKTSASASSQDRQLDLAVKAVVAMIGEQLVADTPGAGSQQDYYDYPDANNLWLASLEPASGPVWPQVSVLQGAGRITGVQAKIVADREAIDPNDPNGADADGDGVADAIWFRLRDLTTGKARPVYAAVRIIDHSGMLNVNTAYLFDPRKWPSEVDGSDQMQVDLAYLASGKVGDSNDAVELNAARVGGDSRSEYLTNVVWNYGDPPAPFSPFDISDELELRNRFTLNLRQGYRQDELVVARIERLWRTSSEKATKVSWAYSPYASNGKQIPYEDAPDIPLWFSRIHDSNSATYDLRHISTVYNMDRLIDPAGARMVNVNDVNVDVRKLYEALFNGIDPGYPGRTAVAAQLAVNIRDLVDSDSKPTAFKPPGSTVTYYGLEPQPFIRQIGFKISAADPTSDLNNEFGVELYNPFEVSIDLGNVHLYLRDQKPQPSNNVDVKFPSSTTSIGPHASVWLTHKPGDPNPGNLVLAIYRSSSGAYELSQRFDLALVRQQDGKEYYLDRQTTADAWFDWKTVGGKSQYYARADARWNILYPDMALFGETLLKATPSNRAGDPTTWDWVHNRATRRDYNLPSPQPLPLTSMKDLATIGDISRLLLIGPEPNVPSSTIGDQLRSQPAEETVRLDIRNTKFADIFQYVTAMSPGNFGCPSTETRVKGRINVNTAPGFVINRLPWLQWAADREINKKKHIDIGQAIVDYRSKNGAFRSIGDLMQVAELACMQGLADQEPNGPDLTPDGEPNDLEARDLLFSRISNLVTVRSDVFSAYIVVRIGETGPQRRVLAILDRSQVKSPSDQVRVIALQTVPDPR